MKGHKAIVLAAAFLLWAAGFSPCPAQTTKPKASGPKWPSRYEITVKVPEILRKHLAKEFLDLATGVYPEADAELIRADVKSRFLCEEYTFQVGKASGVSRYPKVGKSRVRFALKIPLGRSLSVWTTAVPAGIKVKVPDKPLTLDQAKPIAESAMKRIPRNLLDPAGMKLTEAYTDRRQASFHRFTWSWESSGEKQTGQQRSVQIFVRSKDGVVETVNLMRTSPPAPKIPFDQMAARAKKVIQGYKPKHLKYKPVYHYSAITYTWAYWPDMRAPRSQRCLSTMWDPATAEMLYSRCFRGGTYDRSYRNPKFYFEPTEEAVKSQLEKFLAETARKLEQEQKAAAATQSLR